MGPSASTIIVIIIAVSHRTYCSLSDNSDSNYSKERRKKTVRPLLAEIKNETNADEFVGAVVKRKKILKIRVVRTVLGTRVINLNDSSQHYLNQKRTTDENIIIIIR